MRQTPERELLKLIEESSASKSNQVNLNTEIKKYKTLSLFSSKVWQSRILFFFNRTSRSIRDFKTSFFELKSINKILELFLVVLVIIFINNLISFAQISHRVLDLKFKPKELKSLSLESKIETKPSLSSYLEKLTQRDIFSIVLKKEDIESPPSPKIIEATQHLKLVGISWSNDPDAMIEDTKAMRTFFVKRGQVIGEIKVEEIYKDKVLLSYGGEKIELK